MKVTRGRCAVYGHDLVAGRAVELSVSLPASPSQVAAVARVPDHHVVAGAAVVRIDPAGAARQRVVAGAAVQRVVAGAAVDEVVAVAAGQRVVAVAAGDRVVVVAAVDGCDLVSVAAPFLVDDDGVDAAEAGDQDLAKFARRTCR